MTGVDIDRGCLNFKEVFEIKVLTVAARNGERKPCHIGLVFGICVEKSYHLEENGERRRYKGRSDRVWKVHQTFNEGQTYNEGNEYVLHRIQNQGTKVSFVH